VRADAEVDAVGIEGVECAKGFGDLERRVVRQHDAPGAEPDARGCRADAGEHDLGCGAGEEVHGMVLGHPEAVEAEGLDMPGERDGVLEGLGGGRA